MTIDKAQLKALAEASLIGDWYEDGDLRYHDDRTGETHGLDHHDSRFIAAAKPSAILGLLAEIEKLMADCKSMRGSLKASAEMTKKVIKDGGRAARERDQLRTKNEFLIKRIADDERKLDALLSHCAEGECVTCGQIICKHGDGMHFHHDGCPSCAQEGEPDSDLGEDISK